MEYRNFFENLKFINIVNFFCEDRLLQQASWLTVLNTVALFTTVPLSYLLITMNEIESEKASISDR